MLGILVVVAGKSQEIVEPVFDGHILELTMTVTEKGRAVAGLTRDDFGVFDDDRPVEISRFEADGEGYIVGFQAPRQGNNKLHKLKVNVDRPGLKVRFNPKSYRDTSIDQEMQGLVREVLDRGGDVNPLGMRLEVREAISEDGVRVLPVEVRIPLANLKVVERSGHVEGRVSIYVLTRHAQTGVAQRPIEGRVPISYTLARFRRLRPGQDLTHTLEIVTPAGKQTTAVVVRDDVAAVISTAQLRIKVP